MPCHLFRMIIETSGNIKNGVSIIVDKGVCVLQGEAHGSGVSAGPLAEGPPRPTQKPPLQSVFLYGQAQRVPDAEGGEARPGAHKASGSLLPVTRGVPQRPTPQVCPAGVAPHFDHVMRLNELPSVFIHWRVHVCVLNSPLFSIKTCQGGNDSIRPHQPLLP